MAEDTTQADGYYGDNEIGNEEIDLSFLDEKDEDTPRRDDDKK